MLMWQMKGRFLGYAICLAVPIMSASYEVDFDALLERTAYAQMLREIICMTDSIGLLRRQMDLDERRFIEDSILGKIVRVHRLLMELDAYDVVPEDVHYLHYWLELALQERLPDTLQDEISDLNCKIAHHFKEKESC